MDYRVLAQAAPAGVYSLAPARVAALINLGMVTRLPAYVEQMQRFQPEAPPNDVLARSVWYALGDPFRPRGIIGVEVRFSPSYCRWTLEITELRGENVFVIRALMRHVAAIAKHERYLLTGETHAENHRMLEFAARVFGAARPDRVRFAWEF